MLVCRGWSRATANQCRRGFSKSRAAGPVMLRTLNLDGDRQADLSVHGGPSKAVYVYPSEHYDYWKRELPEMQLPWGMFGENFTTAGLYEIRGQYRRQVSRRLRRRDGDPAAHALLQARHQIRPLPTSSKGSSRAERTGFLSCRAATRRDVGAGDADRTHRNRQRQFKRSAISPHSIPVRSTMLNCSVARSKWQRFRTAGRITSGISWRSKRGIRRIDALAVLHERVWLRRKKLGPSLATKQFPTKGGSPKLVCYEINPASISEAVS